MLSILKKILIQVMVLQLAFLPVQAQDYMSGFTTADDVKSKSLGNEYVSGGGTRSILMKVNLWGAVSKPGIHYIPTKTDLISLLSYAGGPRGDALLEDVYIKRREKGRERKISISVDQLLRGEGGLNPTLEANDIIVIPRDKPVVTSNTVLAISLVGSIVSILISGFILSEKSKGN